MYERFWCDLIVCEWLKFFFLKGVFIKRKQKISLLLLSISWKLGYWVEKGKIFFSCERTIITRHANRRAFFVAQNWLALLKKYLKISRINLVYLTHLLENGKGHWLSLASGIMRYRTIKMRNEKWNTQTFSNSTFNLLLANFSFFYKSLFIQLTKLTQDIGVDRLLSRDL